MTWPISKLVAAAVVTLAASIPCFAQANKTGPMNWPIILNPDDKPAYPEIPAGADLRQNNIPHGSLQMVTYDSKTVGVSRKMQVYLPPNYSTNKRYPVLYLLHGIGGDETEWEHFVQPDVILDNLIAAGTAIPMIVVMPNGRAEKDDRAVGDVFKHAPAFANFEHDLLDDVIPTIDSRFSASTDRKQRAVAGLSMGAGQSLNFGLSHLDRFAWIGAFSAAPNTKPPGELIADLSQAKTLSLLWISCGSQDHLLRISQGVHAFLTENHVEHVWSVDAHAHDTAEWKHNFYYFVRLIFR